jgi:hypothetical protein
MPKYKIDEKTLSGIKNLALNLKPEGFYLLGLIVLVTIQYLKLNSNELDYRLGKGLTTENIIQ